MTRDIGRLARRRDDPRARRWLRDLWSDLGHAIRQLRRAPAPAAFIVATLAIGIGANVTMAGIIDRLLLRAPAGLREPDRLARLLFAAPGAPIGAFVSYPEVLEYQRDVPAFTGVAASTPLRLPLGTGPGAPGPDAPEVLASLVSPSFFPVLGVRPALGRLFGPGDDFPTGAAAGGPPLAVLAYGFWRRQFGGDPGVIGRPVRVGAITYTVVGVAPPQFQGLEMEPPDLWLPLTVTAEAEMRPFLLEDRSMSWLSVVARLQRGVARETAETQATPIARRDAPRVAPYDRVRVVAASVIRGRGPDAPREVQVALWLGGIAALVLLIACANVANLQLARAFTRRGEIGVRLALGAGRGRLARQLLAESLVLAACGGAAALALAGLGTGLLRGFFLAAGDVGTDGFVDRLGDARLFAFTALVALGTGVLVSLAPLAQSTAPDLTRVLRAGATAGGGRTSRARAALLGTQAALCVLLLVGAGLFAQSLRRVEGLDLGMDPDRVLAAHVDLRHAALSRDAREATYAEMVARVRAIPGVTQVALAESGARAVNVHTATRNTAAHMQRTHGVPYESSVDSNYFRVLGTPLHGRDFASGDVSGAPPVAIINAPLAALLFPGQNALGQCVYLPLRADDPDGDCWTVVGVLQGYWYQQGALNREGLQVYVPVAQRRFLGRPKQMMITVSGSGAPAALIPAIRAALLRVRPDLPRVRVEWMRDRVEPEIRPWRLGATMFSLFGGVALVIAAVGLYAVVSFTAVHLALGARTRHVLAAVAADGLSAVAAGLAAGLAAAFGLRRWVGPLLFQTSPSDPAVMAGVAAVLFGVAVVAILVPTRRALRYSPARMLRID